MPKENASYKCLLLIMLDSVVRVNKRYYPQTLLEECKDVIRKNKMESLIKGDLIIIIIKALCMTKLSHT